MTSHVGAPRSVGQAPCNSQAMPRGSGAGSTHARVPDPTRRWPQVPGSRRPKVRWVQRDGSGSVRRSFERRHDLEDALEREAAAAGGAWLGQLGGGVWEIRPKAVAPALGQVLKGLVASGLVCAVPSQVSGKNHMMYMISNRYLKGEPFPRKERAEKKEEEEKGACAHVMLPRRGLPAARRARALAHRDARTQARGDSATVHVCGASQRNCAISSLSASATLSATKSCCACLASPDA